MIDAKHLKICLFVFCNFNIFIFMDNPLVSIIIPIYNVESYLPRCIDSILAQTYTNFELILVDDGSPDNSGRICDDYALKDSRIKVFHNQNMGAGAARKFGVMQAAGDWIEFVDGDDYITEDNLKGLLKNADKGDIIHAMTLDNNVYVSVCGISGLLSNKSYMEAILDGRLGMGPVAKLFKRGLFDFKCWNEDKEIKQNEDLLMLIMLACNAQKVYVDKHFICYKCIYREGSASRSSIPTPLSVWLKLFLLIESLLYSVYNVLPTSFFEYQIGVLYNYCILKNLQVMPSSDQVSKLIEESKSRKLSSRSKRFLKVIEKPEKQKMEYKKFILLSPLKRFIKRLIRRR